MTLKVLVHEAEEGGYWAEVPSLPGCITEGETWDELVANVKEAIDAWLDTDVPVGELDAKTQVLELAV
ncbi:MAG TPA: type II toxin-antitoxin system HicB family antitoxin [Fimbriimonadaceae bacterium]|nr:type II toxin-antitoxin system HicB family antitoxin [Fimbriimonadaceae bacterium]